MDHPTARVSHGNSQQISRDAPYNQEQPHGCRLHKAGQCPLQRGYSREHHIEYHSTIYLLVSYVKKVSSILPSRWPGTESCRKVGTHERQ